MKTTGQILKDRLKLKNFSSVKIRRLVTGGSLRTYQIVYDSRRPTFPITVGTLRNNILVPKVVNGDAETFFGTPWANIENFNGFLEPALFFVTDLSGLYGRKNNYSEKCVYSNKRLEELTIPDLRNIDQYTSDTTKTYKDQRKMFQGQGVKNTKLVDSKYIPETGSLLFIFLTESTEIAKDKVSHKTTNAKVDTKQQYDNEMDKLINNPSKTYDMLLQLENVFPNNSYSDLSWLEVYNGEVVNTKMMKDLLEVADVKLFDNTPAFQFQGFRYRLTQLDASIYPESRPDNVWRKKHGNNGLLDKHFSQLFDKGTFDIFINQMTSVLIKHCKSLNYYKDKRIVI